MGSPAENIQKKATPSTLRACIGFGFCFTILLTPLALSLILNLIDLLLPGELARFATWLEPMTGSIVNLLPQPTSIGWIDDSRQSFQSASPSPWQIGLTGMLPSRAAIPSPRLEIDDFAITVTIGVSALWTLSMFSVALWCMRKFTRSTDKPLSPILRTKTGTILAAVKGTILLAFWVLGVHVLLLGDGIFQITEMKHHLLSPLPSFLFNLGMMFSGLNTLFMVGLLVVLFAGAATIRRRKGTLT